MRSMLLNICLYHHLTGFAASALATSLVELTKTIRETKITINTPSTTSPSPPLTTPTSAYGVISARSASPVHLLPMNAVGQAFYLGGEPTSYCPLIKQTDCPAGNVTSFKGFGSLDTEVPGGQLVFVAPDGHLGFTQAHSAYYPPGSVLNPFTYSKEVDAAFGFLTTSVFGSSGFMACPGETKYQVFAAMETAIVPSGNTTDCLGFDMLAVDFAGSPAAWQYV